MDVAAIISKLDDHGFEDVESADKVDVINAVVEDICSREPWPFLEADVTVVADADGGSPENGEYSVTTGEVAITDLRAILAIVNTSSSGYPIRWVRWDSHTKSNADQLTLTGTPYQYFFKGAKLYLYPIPTAGSFRINYLKTHPVLTAGSAETAILIPPRHHEVITYGALVRMYLTDDDVDAAQGAKAMFDERFNNMRQDLWKLQYDRTDNVLMMDDELYDEWS